MNGMAVSLSSELIANVGSVLAQVGQMVLRLGPLWVRRQNLPVNLNKIAGFKSGL
jgi:hypothetical protein